MSDDEIRQSWTEHYPNWRHDRISSQICRLLCDVILWRARASTLIGTEASRITHLCFELGIPKS